MDHLAGLQSPHHGENIEVRVDDGDDRRSQHEDRQRDGVCGHVAPVEHADEGLAIEDRLVEAEQRRAAHHRHADPREDHPALTSGFRLYGLVSQRFSAKYQYHYNWKIFIINWKFYYIIHYRITPTEKKMMNLKCDVVKADDQRC